MGEELLQKKARESVCLAEILRGKEEREKQIEKEDREKERKKEIGRAHV